MTGFSQPFWDALTRGELLVPECQVCRKRFFTPEPLCIHCGAGVWTWVESPGVGTVYSVSVVHQGVNDEHELPFALAVVELDDGWTMMTHVLGVEPEAVVIGMRVRFAPTRGRNGMLATFRASAG
ncbi:MAG: hypothetical protein JWL64_567 [Frankiales bacterium]|nr:hypothetical protein [Frankiales bacterium]